MIYVIGGQIGTPSAVEGIQQISLWRPAMTNPPRFQTETSEELPKDLVDFDAVITQLPVEHRSGVEAAFSRVIESTKRRRRILNLVQEALSQLRLDMKYLMFDLEATRRERDELRQGTEGQSPEDE